MKLFRFVRVVSETQLPNHTKITEAENNTKKSSPKKKENNRRVRE